MLLLSLLPLLVASVLGNGPVTINQNDVYADGRECLKRCFVGAFPYDEPGFRIASVISCETDPRPQNDCFCRSDLQQDANIYVADCVSSRCAGNKNDIAAATKMYDDYCTSNGYTREAQVTPPPKTGSSPMTRMASCGRFRDWQDCHSCAPTQVYSGSLAIVILWVTIDAAGFKQAMLI